MRQSHRRPACNLSRAQIFTSHLSPRIVCECGRIFQLRLALQGLHIARRCALASAIRCSESGCTLPLGTSSQPLSRSQLDPSGEPSSVRLAQCRRSRSRRQTPALRAPVLLRRSQRRKISSLRDPCFAKKVNTEHSATSLGALPPLRWRCDHSLRVTNGQPAVSAHARAANRRLWRATLASDFVQSDEEPGKIMRVKVNSSDARTERTRRCREFPSRGERCEHSRRLEFRAAIDLLLCC